MIEKEEDYCAVLIEEYENSKDKGKFIPFEEAAKICGIDMETIQSK